MCPTLPHRVRPIISVEKSPYFEICCKSGYRERSVNEVTEIKNSEVEYASVLENAESQVDTETLDVGNVMLTDIMIDSRTLCNCIDELTWIKLKQEGIAWVAEKSQKPLFACGTTEPINVLGSFTCNITWQATCLSFTDEFTVIAGSGRSLLGKTALKLNILCVGPPSEWCLYTELDEKSRGVTTFTTHHGLYRYKRLMHGVASAPEIYQKIIRDTLVGNLCTANIVDYCIIGGVRICLEHWMNWAQLASC